MERTFNAVIEISIDSEGSISKADMHSIAQAIVDAALRHQDEYAGLVDLRDAKVGIVAHTGTTS
jgi:hypothetical protein